MIDFIRYAENKTKLQQLVSSDPYYQSMDEDACGLLVKYANIQEGAIKMTEYKGKDSKAEGKLLQLFELVKDGVITVEIAAEKAKMSIEEFNKAMEEFMQSV